MKKIILVFLVVFTIYSFTNENSDFESISQKEVMNSWAWKIFVFIDEGEIHPVKFFQRFSHNNNVRIYEDDFFLNNKELGFKEAIVFSEEVKSKK